MILDRVAVTGADDGVPPSELMALSREFPWAEFGILFSAKREGSSRYPGRAWLEKLVECHEGDGRRAKLSAHLCGSYVRRVSEGDFWFKKDHARIEDRFGRLQFNLSGALPASAPLFLDALGEEGGRQIVLQVGEGRDAALALLLDARGRGLDAVPLFDRSGGAGLVPDQWPGAPPGIYRGYAGGLGPDNLEDELNRISEAAGPERVWVDMETKVRSGGDSRFDLALVARCLEVSRRWINGAASGGGGNA